MFSSPLTLIKNWKEVRKRQIFLEQKILCSRHERCWTRNGLSMPLLECKSQFGICVGGSSKIQTLSHDSSFIKIEVYKQWKDSQVIKVDFLHLQMCRYIIYPVGVSHTHLNHVIL